MSYTVEDLFVRACSLVDSLTDDGDVDVNTTADYRGRTLTLTDICQKELMNLSDNSSIYKIARKKPKNMFGDASYFRVEEYEADEDKSLECSNDFYGGVKGYYFETNAESGTAYVEDYDGSWNTLATITLLNTGVGFNVYKNTVTPTNNATKSRIRFTGDYHYLYVNVALYNYPYETIPSYRPWIPIQLPVDCKRIESVSIEYPNSAYSKDNSYKVEWEGNRQTLYSSFYFEGTMRVVYKPVPVAPTAFTDTISVDDLAAQGIVYYLAMNFVGTEQNTDLKTQFRSQYEMIRDQVAKKQPESEDSMIDYYDSSLSSYPNLSDRWEVF